jgi:hypothetical protein
LLRQQSGDVCGTAKVLAAVGIAEAEIGAETGAEVITIKEDHRRAGGLQMIA